MRWDIYGCDRFIVRAAASHGRALRGLHGWRASFESVISVTNLNRTGWFKDQVTVDFWRLSSALELEDPRVLIRK